MISGTFQLSVRPVFTLAVLITAFSSLLTAATPLSARQFSPKAFQCVEGDSTGTMFYMGDGSTSKCAPGTVCRYVPGQTWSPCCVAPDAASVTTGPEIPDKSSEAPGGGFTIPSAAPADTTPTPPAEYPGVTETPDGEDEKADENDEGDNTPDVNDGIDLGAVDNPWPTPSASASTSDLPPGQLKLATNSPPVQGLVAVESSTGIAEEANSPPVAPPSSGGQMSAATVSLSDYGADGYATYHPGESAHGTACGDKFGDHADQEPFYVAISPKLWQQPLLENPNNDPICYGKNIVATYEGRTVTFAIRDKCEGCEPDHIDMAPKGFEKLFNIPKADGAFGTKATQKGRNGHLSWKIVDA